MFEKTQGTVKEVAGRVQEAVGQVTGDQSTRFEGQTRQLLGKAERGYGEVLNRLRESAVTNPVATVAIIVGVGFILGALWERRES
jgi:uncharacterized protein YjbJ (UPF0337 family)